MTDHFTLPALSPLDVADWRIQMFDIYAEVREIAKTDPHGANVLWRNERDDLFVHHPASSPARSDGCADDTRWVNGK